jgi:hypothetical protein
MIPQARLELEVLAEALANGAVSPALAARVIREKIIPKMVRRSPVRRTPVKNGPLTPSKRATVDHLAATTSMSQMEIAMHVGVNPGRISEHLDPP